MNVSRANDIIHMKKLESNIIQTNTDNLNLLVDLQERFKHISYLESTIQSLRLDLDNSLEIKASFGKLSIMYIKYLNNTIYNIFLTQ